MMEIRSKARRLKSKEPNLGLIVVDYIQLMTSGGTVENRVQEVSQISRNLKVLARDLDVPVLALSQLSRAVEQRHDKRPILSDLRESGSIEQDADLVFFIYRDEYYNDETDQQGIAEIHLAKHRNGTDGDGEGRVPEPVRKVRRPRRRVGQTQSVPATVIVGAQWGDEGKGKIVDLLAQHSDLVCRYQGGPNAGHTIVADGETYKFRHMPSGILWGKECVLGAGCVVDPAGVHRGAGRPRGARALDRAGAPLGQRAPDHAVARRARPGERAAARQAPDRHDAARDRAGVRGQGGAARDPRPGPARPEDPAPEDRGRARGEEPLARAGLRRGAARPRGRLVALRGLRAAAASVRRGHIAARRPRAARRAASCSSRAHRERCSTSTTARIRSSPRRTRSPARRRRASGSGRTGSTPCSAWRRRT